MRNVVAELIDEALGFTSCRNQAELRRIDHSEWQDERPNRAIATIRTSAGTIHIYSGNRK